MAGYDKIACCCKQAASDGFEWVWIDTCSIDKRSSAELSEAINSMYNWYWRAEKCYAYLADTESFKSLGQTDLEQIRWFKRGWTLQELLAPEAVEFYNCDWKLLGTKVEWADLISSCTGIDTMYIKWRHNIKSASIATKFSWTALRETTRGEDIAYCLLGLVGVNMPLLYGEGQNAFRRLQLEILKKTNEHSIFAWEIEYSINREYEHKYGLLAQAPSYFRGSSDVFNTDQRTSHEHTMTNKGVRAYLPCIHRDKNTCIAILNCRKENEESDNLIGVLLKQVSEDQYIRIITGRNIRVSTTEAEGAESRTMYIVANGTDIFRIGLSKNIKINWPHFSSSTYSLEILCPTGTRIFDLRSSQSTGITRVRKQNEIGLHFRGDSGEFVLVCGVYPTGAVWSNMEEYAGIPNTNLRIKEFLSKCARVQRMPFAGDYRKWTLLNGTEVILRALKKRFEGCTFWDINITVSDPRSAEN